MIIVKKLNCLILFKVLFILLFFSCSKDHGGNHSMDTQKVEITPAVKQLLASGNITFNAISFGDLISNNEKYSYVYNKISQTISLLNLNKIQVNLANELLENLSPEIYTSSDKKDYFVGTFLPKWLVKANANFTFNEIKMIFASYHSPSEIKKMFAPINVKTKAVSGSKASTSCDVNEEYSICGSEGTLDNPTPPITPCTAGCFCASGYLRAYPGGPCVSASESGGGGVSCDCKTSNSVATLCGGVWNANEYCKSVSCKTIRFCGVAFAETCNGRCEPN